MSTTNLAEAKTPLSQLVEQASGGEDVQIMRRDTIVAQITAVEKKHKPIALKTQQALTATISSPPPDATSPVVQMRDAARY